MRAADIGPNLWKILKINFVARGEFPLKSNTIISLQAYIPN